ncbi:RDD family protein [Streptomyces sp. TR06-5]|uniref:RDD family protein n=1 Tax=unclassified Streptomyces TaxID=2593676 RepID=UPI00399FB667
MSELVTGDAVVLGLRPARMPTRALAVMLDLALYWTLYVVLSVLMLTAVSSLDVAAVTAVQIALFVLVPVGAPIAVETLGRGRSVGKAACGLRVLREDGGPVRFRHALVRGAFGAVEITLSMGVIACIASLVSARGRRLGDVFAGTVVVRERVPAVPASAAPAVPPWLAGRFAGLDLSRVPEPLWLAVRQYLMRADELDAVVGRDMAVRLASDVAARTGVAVPADLPPWAYLAGVLAERRERDAQRAFGTQGSIPGDVAHHGAAHHGAAHHGGAPAEAVARPREEHRTAAPPAAGPAPPPGSPDGTESRSTPGRPATGFVPPV